MTVRELIDELLCQIARDRDIEDYDVVDADGETIDTARPDEAYHEMNLEF